MSTPQRATGIILSALLATALVIGPTEFVVTTGPVVMILAVLLIGWAVWTRQFTTAGSEPDTTPGPDIAAKRASLWLLALVTLYTLIRFILWADAEWAEAIVQAVAAAGGLGYWIHRSRPRVTLREWHRHGNVYIELANVGNRIAKNVELKCKPPLAFDPVSRREMIDTEQFGDMDRGQRHTLMIQLQNTHDTMDATIFTVSHDRTFWFGRHKSTLNMTGSAWTWILRSDAATPLDDIATAVQKLTDKPTKGNSRP